MRDTFWQFIKRDLSLGLLLSALVFVSALAWGGPFLTGSSGVTAWQARYHHSRVTTFNGTIVSSNGEFVLRDSSGKTYRLDGQQNAQLFADKEVKVTGRLNNEASLIHVKRIEPVKA